MLETRDSVQVTELAEDVFGFRGHGPQRPHLAREAGSRRPRARRRARAEPRAVGGRVRPAPQARGASAKRAIARAAAALVEEGEAVALDASTTAYYLALRAAEQARARRRHERAPGRDRAGRRAGDHRPRHGRHAAPVGDVARRRPRHRRPAHDADQQGLPRRARPQPRARPDGPEPRRGADQAGDGRRLRAGLRDHRRHEVASQRAALVRPDRRPGRDRHRLGRARRTRSRRGAPPASR